MLMGLYQAELKKHAYGTANESEIKAILDHQLVNMRTFNTDPRAPSYYMAELRSTYSFETEGKRMKMDEMWKTGKVPMDVNVRPGLVLDESENKENYGDFNTMHNAREYEEWKKKNPNWNSRSTAQKPISCCGKPGHISGECKGERRNNEGRGDGNQEGRRVADMQELTKNLDSESGYAFSLESSNSEELATLEMRRHNFKNNDNDELVNVSNLLNVRQDLFMNLNSMVKLEKDDYKIFNVKYKLFKRDIYGLALVDTGNLVKGTLVFKEFWEMIGGNMSGKSNISVGTVEEEGLKY